MVTDPKAGEFFPPLKTISEILSKLLLVDDLFQFLIRGL